MNYKQGEKFHENIFIDDDEDDHDRYRYDFGDGKHSYGDKPKGHGKHDQDRYDD